VPASRFAVSAVALAASLASPLVALTPAHADPASSAVVFLSDTDNPYGLLGIYAAPSNDLTDSHPVLATKSVFDVEQAKLAPDGQHVLALVDPTAGSNTDSGNYQLQVMDLDGSDRHTLASEDSTDTTDTQINGFTWVGNDTVVYGVVQSSFNDTTGSVQTVRNLQATLISGGVPVVLADSDGLGDPAASPDGNTLAVSYVDPDAPRGELTLRTYDMVSRTLGSTSLDLGLLGQPAWSNDGTKVVYTKDTSTNSAFRSEVDEIAFDKTAATWSPPTALVPTSGAVFDQNPSFAPDDSTVWFDRVDTASGDPLQALWTVGADGTNQQPALSVDGDVSDATVGPVDTTPPITSNPGPFFLNGTRTTLRWTPSDTDVLYTLITRTGNDGTKTFTTSGTSFVDTTTAVGQTYSYTFTAVDAAGNASTPSPAKQVTALATPRITVATPTSNTSATLKFPLAWAGAGNPAGTTYWVQQEVVGGTVYSPVRTTATTTTATGVAGRTYAFRAQAVDAYGNPGPWSAWTFAVVPYDQTSGHYSHGWTTLKSSSLWLGSEAATSTNGATVSFVVASKAAQIIGDKLPSGASFKVYVGSTYKGTVSTAKSTTAHRQVLWSAWFGTSATRTIKLVAVVKTGKTLRIDGFAAQR